jgi:hypothetical protein
MEVKIKDLISQIIADEELSVEDKSNLIEKIIKASHGIDQFIAPGFYLRVDPEKIKETGEIDIQLWYRNVDESGMTMHGPTNYDNSKIIEMMKQEYLSQKSKSK